jgi:esterase/lipase
MKKKKSRIYRLSMIVLQIYIIIGLFLYLRQRKMIYFPPEKENHNFLVETLENEGESIDIIVLNKGQQEAIIYFGGNAENVLYSAIDYKQLDYALYLVNYRGYGGSTGKPTEQGLYSDAIEIYDHVAQSHTNISVEGLSLGTGVATYLASKKDVEKLMLITPFDSMQSIAQKQFRLYPAFIILKDKYRSIDRVDKIKAETTVLIAENDQIIPYKNSMNLVNAFPEQQITTKIISNRGHNDISSSTEFIDALNSCFEKKH